MIENENVNDLAVWRKCVCIRILGTDFCGVWPPPHWIVFQNRIRCLLLSFRCVLNYRQCQCYCFSFCHQPSPSPPITHRCDCHHCHRHWQLDITLLLSKSVCAGVRVCTIVILFNEHCLFKWLTLFNIKSTVFPPFRSAIIGHQWNDDFYSFQMKMTGQ